MDTIYIAFFILAVIVVVIDIIYILKHTKIEEKLEKIEDSISHMASVINFKISGNPASNISQTQTDNKNT